jgi:hypothetical protein
MSRPSSRYSRPALNPETLEDLKMLGFLIGVVPPPLGAEDAWLWDEARTITGKPMHLLLLAVSRSAMNEDEHLNLVPDTTGARAALHAARAEVFKIICDRALKRGDVEFFKHLASCIEFNKAPLKPQPAEPFKAVVLSAYTPARCDVFATFAAALPQNERGQAWQKTAPGWLDVRDVMERQGRLPSGFLDKDWENQRRQIESALKSLGLPFTQKRQA